MYKLFHILSLVRSKTYCASAGKNNNISTWRKCNPFSHFIFELQENRNSWENDFREPVGSTLLTSCFWV